MKVVGVQAVIAAAAGVCLSAIASAAEPSESPTTLGKVTVTGTMERPYTVEDTASATKLPLSLRDTPQSVTVVTRERLDDQNLLSLRDCSGQHTGRLFVRVRLRARALHLARLRHRQPALRRRAGCNELQHRLAR